MSAETFDDREAARRRTRSVVLWLLAASALLIGAWAAGAPRSFYDDFVFGRQWIALDGPYNEHLVRDVGGLNLALAVVTIAAALRPDPARVRIASLATLAFAIPHVAYHLSATGPYGTADTVALLGAVGSQVLVPAALLWEVRR